MVILFLLDLTLNTIVYSTCKLWTFGYYIVHGTQKTELEIVLDTINEMSLEIKNLKEKIEKQEIQYSIDNIS